MKNKGLDRLSLYVCVAIWAISTSIYFGIFVRGVDAMKLWSNFLESVLVVALMVFVFCFVMSIRFSLSKKMAVFWTLSLVGFVPFIILSFTVIYSAGMVESDIALDASDYLYFSVVTFTTLGYGDFKPIPDARLLAALQAFLGFTFVPVLISEFLALTASFRRQT